MIVGSPQIRQICNPVLNTPHRRKLPSQSVPERPSVLPLKGAFVSIIVIVIVAFVLTGALAYVASEYIVKRR